MAKLEARDATLAGTICMLHTRLQMTPCLSNLLQIVLCVPCVTICTRSATTSQSDLPALYPSVVFLKLVVNTPHVTAGLSTMVHSCSARPAAKRNEYQAYETEVFEALAALVRDAASLRVYLAAAMRVEAETFTRATVIGQVSNSASPMNQSQDQPMNGQHALANNQAGLAHTQNGLVYGQNGLTSGETPYLSDSALS